MTSVTYCLASPTVSDGLVLLLVLNTDDVRSVRS